MELQKPLYFPGAGPVLQGEDPGLNSTPHPQRRPAAWGDKTIHGDVERRTQTGGGRHNKRTDKWGTRDRDRSREH